MSSTKKSASQQKVAPSPHLDPSATQGPDEDLQSLPMAEVEERLGSSSQGLTGAEASRRLTQFGPNEIVESRTSPLLAFLAYFWGPIPWMIEAAVVLSAVARHWPDFAIILVLLLATFMTRLASAPAICNRQAAARRRTCRRSPAWMGNTAAAGF